MNALANYGYSSGSDSDEEEVPQKEAAPVVASVALPPADAPEEEDEAENPLAVLEAQKAAAVEAEDYGLAKELKAQIDAIKAGRETPLDDVDAVDAVDAVGAVDASKADKKKKKKDKKEKKKKKKEKKEKKKSLLPSAAALLSNLPASLLGRAENIIVEGEVESAAFDKLGTKYNTVAPPSNLACIDDDEKWRLKPTMSVAKQREATDQVLAKFNKEREKKEKREARWAAKDAARAERAKVLPAASGGLGGGFGGLVPRQVGSKRANTSTEDLVGWGIKKAK